MIKNRTVLLFIIYILYNMFILSNEYLIFVIYFISIVSFLCIYYNVLSKVFILRNLCNCFVQFILRDYFLINFTCCPYLLYVQRNYKLSGWFRQRCTFALLPSEVHVLKNLKVNSLVWLDQDGLELLRKVLTNERKRNNKSGNSRSEKWMLCENNFVIV